jgi:hypothetical protein
VPAREQRGCGLTGGNEGVVPSPRTFDVLRIGGHISSNLIPLKNITVTTVADGVELSGVITAVRPNEMSVVITSPVAGLGTDLHVPHFAMYPGNWLATDDGHRTRALTERGQRRAEDLLRELYAHSQGRGSGWGVYPVGEDPQGGVR